MIVLDSSAVLAMLFFEPGHERIAELVPQSRMSTVNLAEVLGRLPRDGRAVDRALERLDQMRILWIDCERELAIGAAALLPLLLTAPPHRPSGECPRKPPAEVQLTAIMLHCRNIR